MNKYSAFIYGSEEFELLFDVPIDDAINRLSSHVRKTSFSRLFTQRMVGRVSKECVKIQRVRPFLQNSFKPLLVGSFSTQGDKTKLSGAFRFHRFVQAFMTFWFGFILLWVALASIAVLTNPLKVWYLPFFGVLMIGFGIGLVKFGKWFSRHDKNWLKEQIINAIEENS